MRAARIAHMTEIIPGIPRRCCEHERGPMRGCTGGAGANEMTANVDMTSLCQYCDQVSRISLTPSLTWPESQDPYLEYDPGSNGLLILWVSLGGFINKCVHHSPSWQGLSHRKCPTWDWDQGDRRGYIAPVRKQGSIHLHYCFDTGCPAGPYGDIYFIFVQSSKNSWLGMSQRLGK